MDYIEVTRSFIGEMHLKSPTLGTNSYYTTNSKVIKERNDEFRWNLNKLKMTYDKNKNIQNAVENAQSSKIHPVQIFYEFYWCNHI